MLLYFTLPFKVFYIEINTFIQHIHIKWIKLHTAFILKSVLKCMFLNAVLSIQRIQKC